MFKYDTVRTTTKQTDPHNLPNQLSTNPKKRAAFFWLKISQRWTID
jgi:hypothetical protein